MTIKKIFLVDDEPITNFVHKKMFSSYNPDFDIQVFTDASKALSSLGEASPDVIFLDINMPVMDGWEFLTQMEEQHIEFPVIMLTSSTSNDDVERSKTFHNVKGYQIKPLALNRMDEIFAA